jgi:hypothetical protein
VAGQLFVTEKTVKFHLTNIYKKMSVKSRAQLIVWCLPHLGFIEAGVGVSREPAMKLTPVQPGGMPVGNGPIAQPLVPGQNQSGTNGFGSGSTGNSN